jgi:ribosome-interacting GTPase 1
VQGHLGLLKAKLAKLRTQLLEPAVGAGKGPGEGFDVVKYGDARIALIGFPSVGKSTALALCKSFLQPTSLRLQSGSHPHISKYSHAWKK